MSEQQGGKINLIQVDNKTVEAKWQINKQDEVMGMATDTTAMIMVGKDWNEIVF